MVQSVISYFPLVLNTRFGFASNGSSYGALQFDYFYTHQHMDYTLSHLLLGRFVNIIRLEDVVWARQRGSADYCILTYNMLLQQMGMVFRQCTADKTTNW